VARLLLAKGAMVDYRDPFGDTALSWAKKNTYHDGEPPPPPSRKRAKVAVAGLLVRAGARQ